MSFNLEDLLQFINLNPELQAKFTDMEAKITELENYIKQHHMMRMEIYFIIILAIQIILI